MTDLKALAERLHEKWWRWKDRGCDELTAADLIAKMAEREPLAWRVELRWADRSKGGDWRHYATYEREKPALALACRANGQGDIETRIVPLYAAPPDDTNYIAGLERERKALQDMLGREREESETLLRQALEALEESVGTVEHEYVTDWRHGIPTRAAQLAGIKDSLDAHKAAIDALRARLEGAPQPVSVADELPPLPEHDMLFQGIPMYSPTKMRDYACAALAMKPARVPMTDEQIWRLWKFPSDLSWKESVIELVKQVERHHGIRSEE